MNPTFGFPIRTTILTLIFCSGYGLLYFVSTVAFNSIVTSVVLFSNITYSIPQLIVAFRGRENVLPDHKFDLGIIGRLCNIFAPVFVAVLAVFVCFPPELPLTTANINYTPAILAGFYAAIVAGWYLIGGQFEGPKIDWDVLKNTKVT